MDCAFLSRTSSEQPALSCPCLELPKIGSVGTMPIAIACPACGKKYKINEDRFGRQLRCQCSEVFRAPGEKQNSTAATVTPATTPAADKTGTLPRPVQQNFEDIPSLAPLD